MKKGIKYFFSIILIGLPLGWWICLLGTFPENGYLEIINKSNQLIEKIEIVVSKAKIRITDLPVASSVGVTFPISLNSGYDVKVTFSSGKVIEKSLGYVSRDFKIFDVMIISSESIEISEKAEK